MKSTMMVPLARTLGTLSICALFLAGCGGFNAKSIGTSQQASSADAGEIGAGAGSAVAGKGASSVPTAEAVVARLQNGLEGSAKASAGNFAKALLQVKSNLPKVTDPTKASGFDQVQLLVYAACSDLTTGTTPVMQSKYKINPRGTVSDNRSALVSAGLQMIDQYTAGLASQGPTSAKVNEALAKLVTELSGNATNTATIGFMSVCIAANTAGTTLLGF